MRERERRERGSARMGEGQGARGHGPERAGLGHVVGQKPTTRTATDQEPNHETRLSKHTIKHDIRQEICLGMMQHP
jgi:hypothetical protein